MHKDINIKAAILDMDGVITRTAVLNAESWKIMFDEFLEEKEKNFRPFDVVEHYRKYIYGKPRLDGVRIFLESRGIKVFEGSKKTGAVVVKKLTEIKNLPDTDQGKNAEELPDALESYSFKPNQTVN